MSTQASTVAEQLLAPDAGAAQNGYQNRFYWLHEDSYDGGCATQHNCVQDGDKVRCDRQTRVKLDQNWRYDHVNQIRYVCQKQE